MDFKAYLPAGAHAKETNKMVRLQAEHHKKLRQLAGENTCTMSVLAGALIDMAFEKMKAEQ
jgi:hypothetical protein